MSNFFSSCASPSALMSSTGVAANGDLPDPPAKGAFSSKRDKDKHKAVAQRKSQQQACLSLVVQEFFWIGSSIVVFSKWRLGHMGKLCYIHYLRLDHFYNVDIGILSED